MEIACLLFQDRISTRKPEWRVMQSIECLFITPRTQLVCKSFA